MIERVSGPWLFPNRTRRFPQLPLLSARGGCSPGGCTPAAYHRHFRIRHRKRRSRHCRGRNVHPWAVRRRRRTCCTCTTWETCRRPRDWCPGSAGGRPEWTSVGRAFLPWSGTRVTSGRRRKETRPRKAWGAPAGNHRRHSRSWQPGWERTASRILETRNDWL